MQTCSLLKWDSNSKGLSGQQERKVLGGKIPFHPCMDDEAHYLVPRLHLPVAPLCNINCRFCNRRVSSDDKIRGPGLTSRILTPEQALEKTKQFFNCFGSSGIIGIAGPGDPLANQETIKTFELIRQVFPKARFCLCTNGLNLPGSIKMLRDLNFQYLTVTVNGLIPDIVAKITPWVNMNGHIIRGVKGARILIENQLEGIRAALSCGMFVKINTVVIPDINGLHIEKIAETIKMLGAGLFNPVPLIPGSNWKEANVPSQNYMKKMQDRCGTHIRVFKKCKQCRADAEGIPGKEECLYERK